MTGWLDRCHFGDCLETLRRMPDGIVNTCVTSPPYFGLRDYGHAGQIGLEPTPDEFIAKLVEVFREVRRVLRDDGTVWMNMGDSYAGSGKGGGGSFSSERPGYLGMDACRVDVVGNGPGGVLTSALKAKDLIGVPWMLAFALRADGWYLRQDIIWAKPNPMPESVTDRCTKSHEYIFLLSKSATYHCDMAAIKEPASPMKPSGQGYSDSAEGKVLGRASNPQGGLAARSRRDSFKRENSKRAEVFPGQSMGTHRPDRQESEYNPDERNKRSVWTVSTKPYAGAHFATFPTDLIEPCILAGAPAGGVVLDPFFGSGTTGQVAQALGRRFIGCELNEAYKPLQDQRLSQPSLDLEAA
jgi:DNA modification methylase